MTKGVGDGDHIRSAGLGTQWQDISTAPKDGTTILVWGGSFRWDDETYSEDYPCTRVATVYWKNDGWCGGYGKSYNSEVWYSPTHWMSLPEPPQVGTPASDTTAGEDLNKQVNV